MPKPIKGKEAQIWNERFARRMNELGLSQRDFISRYRERFGTGSQSDVSKWMRIGEIDGKSKKERKFPTYETMRNIAEILEVSVGYLIGETDSKTFELERASNYMKISPKAVEAIRAITYGKVIPPFFKYPDPIKTAALEIILENPFLVEYLENICDIAEAIDRKNNPVDFFDKALNAIPESYRESAVSLWNDSEDAVLNGIKPTEELWSYVEMLNSAACEDAFQPDYRDREIKSAKYALQEIHIKMVDEILSEENIQQLLPHYATQEEIDKMLKD